MELTIYYFNTKTQDRIGFVKFLNSLGLGLKQSKELMDGMLKGKPITLSVSEDKQDYVRSSLERFNMKYELC